MTKSYCQPLQGITPLITTGKACVVRKCPCTSRDNFGGGARVAIETLAGCVELCGCTCVCG